MLLMKLAGLFRKLQNLTKRYSHFAFYYTVSNLDEQNSNLVERRAS